jgi:hypothetical protein
VPPSYRRVVVNEWIFHDLTGENGSVSQRTAAETLIAMIEQPICVCFMEGSPWAVKAYDLMTSQDPLVRKASRLLQTRLLLDSMKCIRVPQTDKLPARQAIIDRAPRKDRYLVTTYFLADAEEIVSTDAGLISAYADGADVRVTHRTDYAWRVTGATGPR